MRDLGKCTRCGKKPRYAKRLCRRCYVYLRLPERGYKSPNAGKSSRTPEDQAIIERRVAIYAERAARGEPLFEDMEYIWNSIPPESDEPLDAAVSRSLCGLG